MTRRRPPHPDRRPRARLAWAIWAAAVILTIGAVAPAQAWFDLEGRAESVALTSDGQRATLLLSLPAARARNELWALPLACN